MASKAWFDVSKEGLSRIVERRGGVARTLLELIQNGWDQNVTMVAIDVGMSPDGRTTFSVIDDDPAGFADLADAYTLFAQSTKGTDPTKRGRFNLGEKLALAVADEGVIASTTGGIKFDSDGRHRTTKGTGRGSHVTLWLRRKVANVDDVVAAVESLLPPAGIVTTLNGSTLPVRVPIVSFDATLMTELTDQDGVLRRSPRATTIQVLRPREGEEPTIFEMGIPVVEFAGGEPFHVNIAQRVPLNVERDNVTPAYLRALRAAVFNATHQIVPKDRMVDAWVQDATSSPDAAPEAVKAMVVGRFGEKAVAYDPSDQESNTRAQSEGYTVIHGRSMSAEQWGHARAIGAAPAAGRKFPTPDAKFAAGGEDVTVHDLTPGMKRVEAFSDQFMRVVLGFPVPITFVRSKQAFVAAYSAQIGLVWNQPDDWYARATSGSRPAQDLIATLVHEAAHSTAADHLSEGFHDAMGKHAATYADAVWQKAIAWGPALWGKD